VGVNAGKCLCFVRKIVPCQIVVVFVRVSVSEIASQRDHVRGIMSEKTYLRDCVRENLSERMG
jgi:hypothetical protein